MQSPPAATLDAAHAMDAAPTADALRAPARTVAHALPAWVYRHPELAKLEVERILKPSWQLVCHVNSVPRVGDYETLDLGLESVFVLRDRDRVIRAFHNVCRHRGARLLDGAGRCAARITCPYHGWSYRHDGTLASIPQRESFRALEREDYGLRSVPVDVAFGFVFVCLAADSQGRQPAPVAQTWGALGAELAPYRCEDMVPLSPITCDVWPVDWKVAMDNYLESYHVPIGHPGLNRMFTPDYADQASVPGVARGVSWLKEKRSPRWSEGLYQSLMVGATTHLPEAQRRCWRFYSALPNLGLDVFPDQIDFFQLLPGGPGKCIVRGAVFGLPDATPALRALRFLGNRINAQVNYEDKWLCERVQRGLGSSSYRPGPLSALENFVSEFHDLLRERIPEFRLAEAPKAFA